MKEIEEIIKRNEKRTFLADGHNTFECNGN